MKIYTVITALTLSLFAISVSFAQEGIPMDGIFTPGTSQTMTIMRTEPVCWINKANEFNVYLPGNEGTLLTLMNEKKPDNGKLPKFYQVTITDYSFILTTEDKRDYYFGIDSKEEKQVLEYLLKYNHPKFEQTVYGYGLAKHTLVNRGITLEQLKAADSVYDVLEKN